MRSTQLQHKQIDAEYTIATQTDRCSANLEFLLSFLSDVVLVLCVSIMPVQFPLEKKGVSCCVSDLGIVGSEGKSGRTGQLLYPYIDISPANTQPVDSLS